MQISQEVATLLYPIAPLILAPAVAHVNTPAESTPLTRSMYLVQDAPVVQVTQNGKQGVHYPLVESTVLTPLAQEPSAQAE